MEQVWMDPFAMLALLQGTCRALPRDNINLGAGIDDVDPEWLDWMIHQHDFDDLKFLVSSRKVQTIFSRMTQKCACDP